MGSPRPAACKALPVIVEATSSLRVYAWLLVDMVVKCDAAKMMEGDGITTSPKELPH